MNTFSVTTTTSTSAGDGDEVKKGKSKKETTCKGMIEKGQEISSRNSERFVFLGIPFLFRGFFTKH
jgi:hypothetical protein